MAENARGERAKNSELIAIVRLIKPSRKRRRRQEKRTESKKETLAGGLPWRFSVENSWKIENRVTNKKSLLFERDNRVEQDLRKKRKTCCSRFGKAWFWKGEGGKGVNEGRKQTRLEEKRLFGTPPRQSRSTARVVVY